METSPTQRRRLAAALAERSPRLFVTHPELVVEEVLPRLPLADRMAVRAAGPPGLSEAVNALSHAAFVKRGVSETTARVPGVDYLQADYVIGCLRPNEPAPPETRTLQASTYDFLIDHVPFMQLPAFSGARKQLGIFAWANAQPNQEAAQAIAATQLGGFTPTTSATFDCHGNTAPPGHYFETSEVLYLNDVPAFVGSLAPWSRLQTLEITSRRLARLPDALTQLTGLRRLALTVGPRFKDVPAAIAELPLRSLHLEGMTPTVAAPWVGRFSQLKALSLVDMPLPREAVTLAGSLETLSMRGDLGLFLPTELAALTGLQSAMFYRDTMTESDEARSRQSEDDPPIARLPVSLTSLTVEGLHPRETLESLAALTQLRRLRLSPAYPSPQAQFNLPTSLRFLTLADFDTLPLHLALPQLRDLALQGGLGEHLSFDVNYPHLRGLKLDFNRFKIVPEVRAAKLAALSLDGNKLAGPMPTLNFFGLKQLNLEYNRLTALMTDWSGVPQLKVLLVSGNQLTELPTTLASLANLRYLAADHNRLSALPAELQLLKELRKVSVEHNAIETFPVQLTSLRKLRVLKLGHNALKTLPRSIVLLRELVELTLEGNPNFVAPDIHRSERKRVFVALRRRRTLTA